MPRLIRDVAGRTIHFVGFVVLCLITVTNFARVHVYID